MRIIKFILCLVVLALAVSATYGQGVINFGAIRPQDTSLTKGQVRATALANSNPANFLTVDSRGVFKLAPASVVALSNTYVENSVAAMLSLPANVGDVCVRNDSSISFILRVSPPTVYTNWVQLLAYPIVLNNGYAINISGAYPSFTLTADTTLLATPYRLDHYIDSAFRALDDSMVEVRTDLDAVYGVINDTAAAIREDLNNKVNSGDTLAMLAPYLRKNDSALYQTKYRTDTMRENVYAALDTKGSGTVASVSAGTGMSFTTITSTGPASVDTTMMATRQRVQKAVDSLNGVIGTKGNGTVTSVSIGNLSPIFTASIANASTTPAITYTLSTAAAHTFLGNTTGATAAPSYSAITESDLPSTILTTNNIKTVTGKRNQPRTNPASSYTTSVTLDFDNYDGQIITAQAGALLFNAPTWTAAEMEVRVIRIKDNGTARALTWNAIFRGSTTLALPSTTTLGKVMYLQFMYNSTDNKIDLVGVSDGY